MDVIRQDLIHHNIFFNSGGSFSLGGPGGAAGPADPVHILASSLKDRMKLVHFFISMYLTSGLLLSNKC